MRILILVLAVLLPISSLADSALPFMKELAGYVFSDRANLSLEFGFGNREHTLFNFNFRF